MKERIIYAVLGLLLGLAGWTSNELFQANTTSLVSIGTQLTEIKDRLGAVEVAISGIDGTLQTRIATAKEWRDAMDLRVGRIEDRMP